jgi:hypothetical protein
MSPLLNDTAFHGNTSTPGKYAELLVDDPRCLGCGSSLATRRQKTYLSTSTTTGRPYETERYECRCGRGRLIRREVTV